MLVGYVEKLEVTNARGNVLTLQMEEDDGPYQVAEIDGLDPGKAALTSSRNAGADGEVFQSATRPARNIKIKLDLDPDFDAATYESARNELVHAQSQGEAAIFSVLWLVRRHRRYRGVE
jgi:hypothetical protein